LRAGAVGFLRADAHRSTVLAVVRQAAGGSAAVGGAATSRLVTAFAGHTASAGGAVARLTRRERDVLRLVAKGLSNAEVAGELVVTTSTVKTHMNAILGKLDLRDRVQATVFAYENGLVRPGEP
ncbi:MAG TPA: response regulator transcription factor, partial [Cryptosporangiaceae bacterium]|nr:response regulator transcription factor [Cryptosporangiaceae bacterium]